MITAIRERLKSRREMKAAKVHAAWMAEFYVEFEKKDSKTHKIVLEEANRMAQGMVARWLDDRHILRCALDINTSDLRKVGRVYLCKAHREPKK